SVDRGAHWTMLDAPELSLGSSSIQDLAVDPVDPNVAYALSGNGGLFKTTDGGASWKRSSTGIPYQFWFGLTKVVVNPVDRSTLYVGGLALFRSSDAGATWTQINSPNGPPAAWAMAFDPIDGTLYGMGRAETSGFGDFSNGYAIAPGATVPNFFMIS